MNLPPNVRPATCPTCGWRADHDNGPDLHRTHLTHLLADQGDTVADWQHAGRAEPAPGEPPTGTVHLWLALDPQTRRVFFQPREFDDGNFPRGLRGVGWPRRELDVPAADWARFCDGVPPAEQDLMHRAWWDEARADGEPEWPRLPGED